MEYNVTNFRRAVMSDTDLTEKQKVAALGLAEFMDWRTGIKHFDTRSYRYGFLKWVANRVRMNQEEFFQAYHDLTPKYLQITYNDAGPCLMALGHPQEAA